LEIVAADQKPVASYPVALLAQRYPTAKVVAISVFLWSIIVMATAACTSYAGLMVNRLFLGVTEACVAPVFTVYITFWWTRRQQPLRSSLWYGMTGVGTIVTPLISYGIGHIKSGKFGNSTWKYMYLIAGAIACVWSFVILIVLPGTSSPFSSWSAPSISLDVTVSLTMPNS
jgi:MFS family permease